MVTVHPIQGLLTVVGIQGTVAAIKATAAIVAT